MSEFLAMGGYAAFVWPAYGVTFAALGAAVAVVWRRFIKAKAGVARARQP